MPLKLTLSPSPIIPAVLASSPNVFEQRLAFGAEAGAVHLDVIDNEFVRGKALPIEKWPDIKVRYSEAHLMVARPIEWLEKVAAKGISRAIVHIESSFDLVALRNRARELDLLLGFAISPDTDLLDLKRVLEPQAYIQVMGVQPGQTNQRMISTTSLAVSYIHKSTIRKVIISVDGGVTKGDIPELKHLGAQYFVSTSAIFGTTGWHENYEHLMVAFKDGELE